MRRLEYARRARTVSGHARNSAEAVMFLAQVARERHRLRQERRTLERRLKSIEERLTAIATAETKLVPMIKIEGTPDGRLASPPSAGAARPAIC